METELKHTFPDPELCQRLVKALGCHAVLAGLLVNRGIRDAEQARLFLNPSFDSLTNPFDLKDMDRACERIMTAVKNREKILVFGDFDADGVTASSLVHEFLGLVAADTTWYIPHRTKEGYSLQTGHVTMAAENKVDLIITVDCGITSHEAVSMAREEDIDVIVTDHHEPGETLPSALAIINPKRTDCGAGLEFLAGVGVAFYLIMALRKRFRDAGLWDRFEEPSLLQFLDLFAIGTIGDMVPLIKENRVLCLAGLKQIQKGERPGVKALAHAARLDLAQLDSDDVSFKLVPRINAAGRMSHARICVSHLTASRLSQAGTTADLLDQLNLKRQQIERDTVLDIENRLLADPTLLNSRILILWDKAWEPTVLGIVASRLSRKYNRPVVLLHAAKEMATGSCRSIGKINIHQILSDHEYLLEKFGGHAMAAGLSLKTDRLDTLRRELAEHMRTHYTDSDFFKSVTLDAELALAQISSELARQVNWLRPFGTANPEPLFLCRNVFVAGSTIIGNSHRKMVLTDEEGQVRIEAMQFNLPDVRNLPNFFSQLLFRLKVNKFKPDTPQLIVEEL